MSKISRRLGLLPLLLGLTFSPSKRIQCDLWNRELYTLRDGYGDLTGNIEILKGKLSAALLEEMDLEQSPSQRTALAHSQEINALLEMENERLKEENLLLQQAVGQVREENSKQFSHNTELLERVNSLRMENTRLAYYWSEKVSNAVMRLCGCFEGPSFLGRLFIDRSEAEVPTRPEEEGTQGNAIDLCPNDLQKQGGE